MPDALLSTNLPFPVRRGKVRDVYDLGKHLLIVATDRISAFDCVLPNGIRDKGKILTALSAFWFDLFADDFDNHLLSTLTKDFSAEVQPFAGQLTGRSMLVKKTSVVPIECVARGYLAGSGWKEYQQSQSICGIELPPGLRQSDKLPTPIFTPATKESSGHDVNIPFPEVVRRIGESLALQLRERTLSLYASAAAYAAERGVIIADTKLEFGLLPPEPQTPNPEPSLILIDEILTPDSSRFWPADKYSPGREQESFDKQFVRNWLELQHWNKQPPAPPLPDEVIAGTRQRYIEAFEKLTGLPWERP